jgi:hypothetical protein
MTHALLTPLALMGAAARPVPPARLPLPGPCRSRSRPCARRRFPGMWCTGSPTSTAPAAWPTGRSPARWAGAAGTRLTLTAEAGAVVIRRDPSGLVTLPPRSCIPIPAALRHRCGLLPGDPVLLAAVPAEDTLTAYSLAVVDQALAAHIPFPACEGGDR